MKKTNLMTYLGVLSVPLLAVGAVLVTGSPEVAAQVDAGLNATGQQGSASGADVNSIIQTVINTMLFVIGALSVIMLIYGGIRYTTSGGKEEHVRTAKNTILYAIIGLVVAMLAYAIVNWVVDIF